MKEKFDDKEIDSLFHEKLGQEEIAPREIVWTKISQELGGTGGKRPVTWIWWLSGIILLLSVGTWFGISYSGKNKIAANKTGWNYNNPSNSDFDSAPEEQGGVAKTEGGKYTPGKADSSGPQSNTGANENSAANNAANGNQTNTDLNEKKYPAKKKHHTLAANDHSAAVPSGNKPVNDNLPSADTAGRKENTVPPGGLILKSGNDNAQNPPVKSIANEPVPVDGKQDTSLENKKPVDYSDTAKPIVVNPPPGYHAVTPDSSASLAKSDSTQTKADSSKTTAGLPPETIFPDFFISMHGGLDAGKILKVEYNEHESSPTEVEVYNREKIKSTPQQTYSYGIRFGRFIRKKISLNMGAYYSIFETDGNEGHFKFKHDNDLVFKMNTPTSSVNCASSNFDYYDSNLLYNDTFYVDVRSREKYDYFSLQLGASFYALREKHFGVYGALYQNGSFLLKKQMVITVPKSGKEIAWSGKKLWGMNPFVWNAQAALGVEWLPFDKLGLWFEPSFYFSAKLNKENSVNIHPGGMRYLVGLAYHF